MTVSTTQKIGTLLIWPYEKRGERKRCLSLFFPSLSHLLSSSFEGRKTFSLFACLKDERIQLRAFQYERLWFSSKTWMTQYFFPFSHLALAAPGNQLAQVTKKKSWQAFLLCLYSIFFSGQSVIFVPFKVLLLAHLLRANSSLALFFLLIVSLLLECLSTCISLYCSVQLAFWARWKSAERARSRWRRMRRRRIEHERFCLFFQTPAFTNKTFSFFPDNNEEEHISRPTSWKNCRITTTCFFPPRRDPFLKLPYLVWALLLLSASSASSAFLLSCCFLPSLLTAHIFFHRRQSRK